MMSELWELLKRVEPNSLALFLFWVIIHFFAEPLRWHYYRMDSRRSRPEPYVQIFLLSAFLSLTVPMKLGLPARVALLRWKAHLQFTTVTALLALDGMLYYGGWALSALLAMGLVAYAGNWYWLEWPMAALLFLLGLALLWRRRRGGALRRAQAGELDGWRRRWREMRDVSAALSPRVLLMAAGIVVADITTQVARHQALLSMFGGHVPWLQLFTIVAVSFFAGLASLMPLGLGGYDVTLVYLLAQAGIPTHTGMAIVVANRLGSIAVSTLLGGWAGWKLGINPLRSMSLRKGAAKQSRESCHGSEGQE